MGVQAITCPDVGLEELITQLEEIEQQTSDPPLLTDPLVVLIGQNNNVLGIGFVTEVNRATVELSLLPELLAALGVTLPIADVSFTVNLCCGCSILVADLGGVAANIVGVLQLLSTLGVPVIIPGL